MAGALDGLRVLDLTRVVAGPLCAQMLGDLGAEVAKVERRGDGDDLRALGPPFVEGSDDSTYFVSLNRNKRSVSVDFAQPAGAAILRRMAARADVLIENFRTGTLARYGLSSDELRAVNPRLVYCSITGFGQDGPYAGRSGYDFVAQAMAGLMEVTGEADGMPGGGPQRVGVPVADMFTGFAATVAILAALRHRDATGQGQFIDVNLFETMTSLMQAPMSSWLNAARIFPRSGNDSPVAVPYGVFDGSDAKFVIGVLNDREFVRLAAALGHPEWAEDPRFRRARDRSEHRAALLDRMRTLLRTRPRAEWLERLEEAKITSGPINTARDVEADPHIQARGMIVELPHHAGGTVRVPGSPLRLDATPVTYRHGIPAPGGDTDAVLADFAGMDANEIAAARAAGIV
ncbi:CaiB/BaiF CoA-transferase family protein [Roseomonas sp. CECT 9278]|uniref:CaiB/BaiF CoA transferase family protein n=1 Tax=Roseomonas sp. CECT 9278 TaxID=2845823 RepID=UPI001E4528A3|nr:CoA transferase [Roseomonas sp. CECT 9278]CAH0303272.1 Acetyl-CoA:oxalate CoA-transferase [Roseomonas sp. CECT 9278]